MRQLESRTLETVVAHVTGDAAKRILKYEKLYSFARVKP